MAYPWLPGWRGAPKKTQRMGRTVGNRARIENSRFNSPGLSDPLLISHRQMDFWYVNESRRDSVKMRRKKTMEHFAAFPAHRRKWAITLWSG
ncbi:hypothetical protein PXJ20_23495 [Paraburkholderia sp. A1RI_3L]|jgi:hypothetical protein|uniref:hypothetical protein n=1 Tax=Paraburkholderia TaxID=1822464 RepID=UPI000F896CCE|nr:hypothetical protein [Paraburkholderia kururiensis]